MQSEEEDNGVYGIAELERCQGETLPSPRRQEATEIQADRFCHKGNQSPSKKRKLKTGFSG